MRARRRLLAGLAQLIATAPLAFLLETYGNYRETYFDTRTGLFTDDREEPEIFIGVAVAFFIMVGQLCDEREGYFRGQIRNVPSLRKNQIKGLLFPVLCVLCGVQILQGIPLTYIRNQPARGW